uniref:Uncharacterized protein n=1 Tax=Tanacetum cinerariifolium TaxID=118510 RepID=A0A6L2MN29_TANCI|nr:hypothetical protein [Tanacetum cinerariifolium]
MDQEDIQQATLDEALVSVKDRVKIGFCNMRINPNKKQKEATYQVVLDILKLSACYNPFLITADVPQIYMQQFWFTITKIKNSSLNLFQLNNQKFEIGVQLFCEILRICPRVINKEFVAPPPHKALVSFLKQLGYKGSLDLICDMYFDHMYQLWRTFAIVINKCLFGKTLDIIMNEDIKNSDACLTYLALSTGTEVPKKGRGKGKGLMDK